MPKFQREEIVRRPDWYRYGIAAAALATIALMSVAAAAQQTWPSRRLTVIVPFPPGGFADTMARVVGDKLAAHYNQPVVVENRPGAGGNIGHKHVADATPDGYTILATTTSVVINDSLYKQRTYQLGDLTPVAISASSPETLTANPGKPSKSLAEFLAWATASDLSYASATGTGSHVAAEYFFRMLAKVKATMIPYQGGAPALTATVSGETAAAALTLPSVVAFVKDGRLNGLAVASARRSPALPDVPTYAEAGFPGFEAVSWVGFFVPAGTPAAAVNSLNAAINAAMGDGAIIKRLSDQGYQPEQRSPADTAAYVRSEAARWGEMVRTVGISVD
jgi:tripartite-type tricarboxylate transporter receptor subunit TctC